MRRTRTQSAAATRRRRGGRLGQWAARVMVIVLAASGVLAHGAIVGGDEAHAAPVEAPVVFDVQSHNTRMDDVIDELRASLVLKVPRGYVDPESGELTQVDGQYLRLGYDFNGDNTTNRNSVRSLRYINTFGAAGAERWAKNQDEYYTVHQVISAGDNDFLVISLEGNMTVARNQANSQPGGREIRGNLYFSFEKSNTASTIFTGWVRNALTAHEVPFSIYSGASQARNASGPVVQVQYNRGYNLWSGGQANLGQVLDHGLNGSAPGVMPANSIPVDLINYSFQTPALGPTGSLSTSFWYAWVHEDGTLVTDVNTGPIHVTGTSPHSTTSGTAAQVVKNIEYAPGKPSLSYTPEAAAQGLTTKVGTDGQIDFRDSGGTGYYRMLVWPEAGDPAKVGNDFGGRRISYQASDLFTGNVATERALHEAWPIGSVYYQYDIPRPEAPVITAPAAGSNTKQNDKVVITGTGTPGHSITLDLMAGGPITDPESSSLKNLVDGDRSCAQKACEVIVQPDGTWSYTYTPSTPLTDGRYALVATQTDQTSKFLLTSKPSNPNRPNHPTEWGVMFEIDTKPPVAPLFTCPASPTKETRPKLSGSGVESRSTVLVYRGDEVLGEAVVSGKNWSFTPDKDLSPGEHVLTVSQVDRAGNESPRSAPACTLTVSIDVPITGKKTVLGVTYPAPGLNIATPDNWELFVSDGETEQVISRGADVQLKRGVRYLVDERLRTDAEPDPTALMYAPVTDPVCVDAKGVPLPEKNFTPATGELLFADEDVIDAPVSCVIENQANQATLVMKRLGGQTVEAEAGWKLRGEPKRRSGRSDAAPALGGAAVQVGFQLSDTDPNAVVRPGEYDLEGDAPDGLSTVGIDRLDLEDPECAAYAPDPTQAPESCWDTTHIISAQLNQGAHEVFRVVAAAPGDLPALPHTGGLGSWIFTLGGVGALAAAAIGLIRRRVMR